MKYDVTNFAVEKEKGLSRLLQRLNFQDSSEI